MARYFVQRTISRETGVPAAHKNDRENDWSINTNYGHVPILETRSPFKISNNRTKYIFLYLKTVKYKQGYLNCEYQPLESRVYLTVQEISCCKILCSTAWSQQLVTGSFLLLIYLSRIKPDGLLHFIITSDIIYPFIYLVGAPGQTPARSEVSADTKQHNTQADNHPGTERYSKPRPQSPNGPGPHLRQCSHCDPLLS